MRTTTPLDPVRGSLRPFRRWPSLLVLTAALVAAGCTSLAPVLPRPTLPVAPSFPDATPAADGPAASGAPAWETDWQEFFRDPRLKSLIGLALDGNRSLQVTTLAIERAGALYQIQQSANLPTVNASATGGRARAINQGQVGVGGQYGLSVGATAWELDLFGRIASLREQALQQYLATREARDSAQIALVASVASAWLSWSADREQLGLARQTLQTQQTTRKLVQRMVELGAATALDLNQAESALQTARGDVARYTALVARDRNALTLLIGQPVPDTLTPDESVGAIAQLTALPVGLPSEVLVRRPDIRQSERLLAAANANIGAARAALFPRIALTASGGLASGSLTDLFGNGTGVWSFAPSITVPVFDRGSLKAAESVARIDRDVALANYEQAVQTGFREVADALADRSTLRERLDAQSALVKASQQAYDLSQARYRSGADSFLVVLDAQRSLYAARQGLITLRQTEAANHITLYKVLGGGWQQAKAKP